MGSQTVHLHDTIPFGSELLQTIVSLPLLMLAGWTRILTPASILLWMAGGSALAIVGICLSPPEKPPRTSRHVLAVA